MASPTWLKNRTSGGTTGSSPSWLSQRASAARSLQPVNVPTPQPTAPTVIEQPKKSGFVQGIKDAFNVEKAGSLANRFWSGAGGNALVGIQKNVVQPVANQLNPEVEGSLSQKFWMSKGGDFLVNVQQKGETYKPVEVVSWSKDIQNPYGKFAVSIPETMANSAYNLATGRSIADAGFTTGTDIRTGAILDPKVYFSDLGKIGGTVLDAYVVGGLLEGAGKAITTKVAKIFGKPTLTQIASVTSKTPGFWQVANKAGLQGLKWGTAYGAFGGLEQGRNIEDNKEYLTQLAVNTVASGIMGYGVGFGLAGINYGVDKAVNHLFVSKTGTFTMKGTPEEVEANVKNGGFENTQLGQDMLAAAKYARQNGTDVGFQAYTLKQSPGGKIIGEDKVAKLFGAKNPAFELDAVNKGGIYNFNSMPGTTNQNGMVYRFVEVPKDAGNFSSDVKPIDPAQLTAPKAPVNTTTAVVPSTPQAPITPQAPVAAPPVAPIVPAVTKAVTEAVAPVKPTLPAVSKEQPKTVKDLVINELENRGDTINTVQDLADGGFNIHSDNMKVSITENPDTVDITAFYRNDFKSDVQNFKGQPTEILRSIEKYAADNGKDVIIKSIRPDSVQYWIDQGYELNKTQNTGIKILGQGAKEVETVPTPTEVKTQKTAETTKEAVSGTVTLYRGGEPGNYYTPSEEFANEFSNGKPLEKVNISIRNIYRPQTVPEATNADQVDAAIREARSKGFKAVYVNEGTPFGEPVESVYVLDKSVFEPAQPTQAVQVEKPTKGEAEKWMQDRYGKTLETATKAQVQEFFANNPEASISPVTKELASKFGKTLPISIKDLEKRPALLYGGASRGVFTDGFWIVTDRSFAKEINDKIKETQIKKSIKDLEKMNTSGQLTHAEIVKMATDGIEAEYKTAEGNYPEYKKIIPENLAPYEPVSPVAMEGMGGGTLILKGDKAFESVNPDYFYYLKKGLPDYTAMANKEDPQTGWGANRAVVFVKDGKIGAMVMPVQPEQRLIDKYKNVAPEAPKVAEQPKVEAKPEAKKLPPTTPYELRLKKDGYVLFKDTKATPDNIAFAFKDLKNNTNESLYVIGVKNDKVAYVELVSLGTINESLISSFEVAPSAIAKDVDGVYLLHNHPSGNPTPSKDDVLANDKVTAALKAIGKEVYGHVVINTTKYGLIQGGKETTQNMPEDIMPGSNKVVKYKKYLEWQNNPTESVNITKPGEVVDLMKGLTSNYAENTSLVYMDTRNNVIGIEDISGNTSIKEATKKAIMNRAINMIVVNPKGEVSNLKQLSNTTRDFNIHIVDALIIDKNGEYKSMKQLGNMQDNLNIPEEKVAPKKRIGVKKAKSEVSASVPQRGETAAKLKRSAELGKAAFEKGIKAPSQDAEMMDMLKNARVGEATPFLKAWKKAWDAENLKEDSQFGSEASRPDKGSRPRDVKELTAKTPEELKELLDNLHKYGQAHAILRRFGGVSNPKAAGVFIHKGTDIPKEGQVRLKEKYMQGDREYISTLAHELAHATELHVTGKMGKETLNVFGKENHQEILKELKDVTLKLEGEAAVASEPIYYNKPQELLARFFEMYITNPELLKETAPTAYEGLLKQTLQDPMLQEYLDITNETMQKVDKVGFQFLPDRRETYQKYLGKKVGNIVYDAEVVHRALVERAKMVLPKFVESKFKDVKDKPELLFRVAEAIRTTKDGKPEFGTRDYLEVPTMDDRSAKKMLERLEKQSELEDAGYGLVESGVLRNGEFVDIYARTRYTPEQAEAMYNELSPQGKQLINDFTAQLSEAKDIFNREMIKEKYKIETNLEGWVHHYFEGEPKRQPMSGKGLKFRQRQAAAAKHRTGTEGYVEDLQKATAKALTELQMASDFNNFVEKQFARVSKPIRKGEKPDEGWIEVVGDIKKGIGLESDKRTVIMKDDKSFAVQRTRYQIPIPVYEQYNKYRGLVQEASGVAKALQRLNSYWAVNILTDAGTAGTNFIGGGIQYSAKVLTDFYKELLTGDVKMPQTRKNISAMLKVLLPKGWAEAPDYAYGADQSNWYGMFQNKNLGVADKAIDKFADANLKLFGTYERYWKKVISTAENVKDLKSLNEVGKDGLRLPTKEEEALIANINKEADLYAYDYDNVPMWLANMKKNPVMVGFKPFATYPYKYAKQISGMIGAAFDRNRSWQERLAKILALSTLVALYSAYSLDRKKKQQTPEGTSPEIEIRAKSGGNVFTGIKDENGKELFVRISKYPFFGLTEAGIQLMRGNTDAAGNIFKEMIGSVGFVGDTALHLAGYRTEYEKYDKPEIVLGNNLAGLVPYTRILSEISRGLDPYMRKPTTFGQTLTQLIPVTDADLQEKLHGEKRTIKIPIEGEVERTPGTKYSRTTVDRILKNYWQDILLSSLTGIYIKRVSPEDVEAQIIRDEKNAKKKKDEDK